VISRYRALLSTPGFLRLLVSSVLGRLPLGMFSLAILLFVQRQTGSFTTAGITVGAFALAGALAGPPLGALVDRLGQTRVLVGAAFAQGALLVALVLAVRIGAPLPTLIGVAALAGAALPPIAGCTRALWAAFAAGETLQTAYALDATTQEVIWTSGPLLVGAAAGFASPAAAVLLCAALTVGGTLAFASSALSRDWRAPARARGHASALTSPALCWLLGSIALAGVVIGAIEVGLPALALEQHARWAAGPLMALFSLGSMAGGLVYSAIAWRGSPARRYVRILLAMALAVAPLLAAPSLAGAFLCSALAGIGVAPMISCQFSLVGALAPQGTTTEAFAWHRAATVAGMAGGSSLGGSLIDSHGAGAAFAVGCAGVALAFMLAALARGRIEAGAQACAMVEPTPSRVAVEPACAVAEPAAVFASAPASSPAALGPMGLAGDALELAAEVVRLAPDDTAVLAARALALAADALAIERESDHEASRFVVR
jgi:MFS family permease